MDAHARRRVGRFSGGLRLSRAIVVLAVGVLVPVLLSTAAGIVAIAIGESSVTLTLGILVVCFMAAAMGGAVVVTVLLGRRARLARMQADLLANVSHELRTPLAAIRLYTQMLQQGVLREDAAGTEDALAVILRETEWLETLFDRLLSWRLGASHSFDLGVDTVDHAVHSALQRFSRLHAPGEVDFHADLQTHLPVRHDAKAVEQVVLNLLINAYKYTREDKRITLTVRDQEGAVHITVADNGIGIPASEHKRIFLPFYRVDPLLKGESAGTGLGLALVQQLVEAHHGTVHVQSREQMGSQFTVVLPAADTTEDKDP